MIGVSWLWGASSARTKAAESPLMLFEIHAERTQRLYARGTSVSQDLPGAELSSLKGSNCHSCLVGWWL